MSARAHESYGQSGLTWVDRFGVWLSHRAILRWLPQRDSLAVLDLGCGYHATQLMRLCDPLGPRGMRCIHKAVGVDFEISPELKTIPKDLLDLTFYEGPIEEILPKLERGAFDVVLLNSVLEHLHKPLDAMSINPRNNHWQRSKAPTSSL